MGEFAERIKAFWRQPYQPEGSVFSWFLFLGLLIVIVFAWSRILRHIAE